MKPSSIARMLEHCVKMHRPVFLWGAPGVGKSDVVAGVAKKLALELRDVRLNLLDPVDLKGYPVPDTEAGLMRWLPADFLPPTNVRADSVPGYKKTAKGPASTDLIPNPSKGLLFLDEMNSAPPSVQAAAYQLILNRRIGDYVLPSGWDIIAAGNRTTDRSVVNAMPAALANRLVHIDFSVDINDWAIWAVENGVREEVLAFLRFKSILLHSFDAKENPRSFPSPRSWSFVSDLIGSGLTTAEEHELIKGSVGEGAAAEFVAFCGVYQDLPNIDEILMHPKTTPVPEKMATLYALSTSLSLRANQDNFDKLMQYVDRMPIEYQVVFTRDAIRRDNACMKTKTFNQWAIKHHDVMGN